MKVLVLLSVALFVVVVVCSCETRADYLPGFMPPPKAYKDGQHVPLKVNKLTSSHTQLPYPYYSLPFCTPKKITDMVENLGEIIMGDKIESSLYEIIVGEGDSIEDTAICKTLCSPSYKPEQLQEFAQRIDEEYRVNWILDDLPAATKSVINSGGKAKAFYQAGFKLGQKGTEVHNGKTGVLYINNHINMKILFHKADDFEGKRIVGFEVEPHSVKYESGQECKVAVNDAEPQPVSGTQVTGGTSISFTYSVKWQWSQTRWASRWDVYLLMTDDQIHWFSIVNSLMIVLFLTGMVAMIMMRTLHADLRRYHEMESMEEAQDETGWKLVHGDVFRPPSRPLMLSVLVGTGVQVFIMALITMSFAVLHFLSPANRGGLMEAIIVLFVLMGVFAGYFSARTYKMFKGHSWKQCMIATALFFPAVVFFVMGFLNVVLYYEGSSGAIPLANQLQLVSLWFGISVPLVLFGSYFGFKKPAIEHPVRTNQIPRQIPEQVWYMQPVTSILMGGILPFGAIFIELFFILSSIWLHQFYYLFGFLAIVFAILILTCAEITIVMCYFQLCSEDYHWWWRAYLTSGACALFMFLYSIYYFTKLEITKLASVLVYFGYTFIMCFAFFLLTGVVGFYACFFFVRKIYQSIKVD